MIIASDSCFKSYCQFISTSHCIWIFSNVIALLGASKHMFCNCIDVLLKFDGWTMTHDVSFSVCLSAKLWLLRVAIETSKNVSLNTSPPQEDVYFIGFGLRPEWRYNPPKRFRAPSDGRKLCTRNESCRPTVNKTISGLFGHDPCNRR